MKRRSFVVGLRWLGLVALGCGRGFAAAQGMPRYAVSARQLERALAQRFPLRERLAGLLELTLAQPQLRFLPEQNRLGALLPIEAAGPVLRQPRSGSLDLDFSLRYEPADQTLRAHRLRVHALRIEGLAPRHAELLDSLGPLLGRQAFGEVVLHRLQPKDLALADGLGLEPGEITVTAQGLVIGFVPKRSTPGPGQRPQPDPGRRDDGHDGQAERTGHIEKS